MHYYLHNGAPKAESYLYTMKRRHNYHHFLHHNQGNEWELPIREKIIKGLIILLFAGFGVTSELWDRLMKTDLNLQKLDEPLEW